MMIVESSTLHLSDRGIPIKILGVSHLDEILDDYATKSDPEYPSAVILKTHGYDVHILLGFPESFVYIDDTDQAHYFITIGNPQAQGVFSFYLLGQHHTEFERRHLIPLHIARAVLREFYTTGQRSNVVQWEESFY